MLLPIVRQQEKYFLLKRNLKRERELRAKRATLIIELGE
jgi:hypothetical protein